MLIKCIFGIITQCFYAKQISSSVNQSGKKYAKKKNKLFILFTNKFSQNFSCHYFCHYFKL